MAWKKKSKSMTPEQERNAHIFRLRGFYANAKTLPFNAAGLKAILGAVDNALVSLGAQSQTDYMAKKDARAKK